MSLAGGDRRSSTRRLAREVALRGPAWAACRAVAWLGRPEAVARWATDGATAAARDAHDDLVTLQRVAEGANGPRAAERAATVVEQRWAAGSEHRAVLWNVCCNPSLLSADAVRLLLAPDPDGAHEPHVRLTSGLPVDSEDPVAAAIATRVLDLACRPVDREVGGRIADVLGRTDHPLLLRLLATDFARALQQWSGSSGRKPDHDRRPHLLWSGDRAEPLLDIVLGNPHLPPPPQTKSGEFGLHEHVMLQVLRDRTDLLDDAVDGAFLVKSLLRYLGNATASSATPLHDTCRRALRSLPPGSGREALCDFVLTRRRSPRHGAAVSAVVDAGYLPADPDSVLRFLLETRQWDRTAERDPTGEQLSAYCRQALAQDPDEEARHTARILLDFVAEGGGPAALRNACRGVLQDVESDMVRFFLRQRAAEGDTVAARIADAKVEQRLRQAADSGDTEAMNGLGRLLAERGEPTEAEQWFRRALDAGPHRRDDDRYRPLLPTRHLTEAGERWWDVGDTAYIVAMHNLGFLYFEQGKLRKAEKWWRQAAELGSAPSMSDIGTLYEQRGNLTQAARWYKRAAAAGNSVGEANLRNLRWRKDPPSRGGHGVGSSDYGGGHYGCTF